MSQQGDAEPLSQRCLAFTPNKAKQFCGPSACAAFLLACAGDQSGPVEGATKILFMQGLTEQGFDHALQAQKREPGGHKLKYDRPVAQLGPQAAHRCGEDPPVVR